MIEKYKEHGKIERVKNTKWCILRYPNEWLAKQAKMSLDEFADFFYNVCTIDYDKNNKMEFHFMGTTIPNLNSYGINHGRYKREDFNRIVGEIKPSFSLILSNMLLLIFILVFLFYTWYN